MTWEVRQADCVEAMAEMDEASVDAIVTDPPYGLEFMGKEWDRLAEVPGHTGPQWGGYGWHGSGVDRSRNRAMQEWHHAWALEALRVLKPGGHLLAFGGTRTYHRLACAVEDAGFEIRDSLIWLYGSGFPKSMDVSKAIDKAAGVEREVVGTYVSPENTSGGKGRKFCHGGQPLDGLPDITAPATPEAQRWQGWGTALKPAHEPIVVARKPLVGTVAANVQAHGTGALNIDGCRIGTDDNLGGGTFGGVFGTGAPAADEGSPLGRWPSNVALTHLPECEAVGERRVKAAKGVRGDGPMDGRTSYALGGNREEVGYADADGLETVTAWRCVEGCPVAELDRQSGELVGATSRTPSEAPNAVYGAGVAGNNMTIYGDTGGASRFFYTAKASRAERNAGLGGFEERDVFKGNHADNPVCQRCGGSQIDRGAGECVCKVPDWRVGDRGTKNHHPTVKPIALMRWLCRLVTPSDGTILDPFLGSGTTGCAAVLEDFDFIGIEREAEYADIARARIEWWAEHQGKEADEVLAVTAKSERAKAEHEAAGQLGLLEDVA